ncbi:MAG: hypothetical protein SFV53_02300, partial [Rickettsiales bacterium]|nr:hypothetical protein [Rickettsiales bacterium]
MPSKKSKPKSNLSEEGLAKLKEEFKQIIESAFNPEMGVYEFDSKKLNKLNDVIQRSQKNVVIDQNILVANRENPLWKILQGCLNQSKPIEDLFCALVIIKDKSL